MALNLTSIVPIYQERISELIESLGKPVRVITSEVEEEDSRVPDWASEDVSPRETSTIKALLDYSAADYSKYHGVKAPQGTLQLKTYITHAPLLNNALYIEPSVDSQHILPSRYELSGNIIPTGLGEDFFLLSFWKIVG